MSIAEKLIKIAENEPKVYEAGKVSVIQGIEPAQINTNMFQDKLQTIANNTLKVYEVGQQSADDLKTTVSGSVVCVNDVSSIEHELGVTVGSKNLFDSSNKFENHTSNGVTWTVNEDKSITINGTATANSSATFYSTAELYTLKAGTYKFTATGGTSDILFRIYQVVDDTTTLIVSALSNGGYNSSNYSTDGVFTFTEDTQIIMNAVVGSGITLENVTVYPQLELGSTATAYTPYISDFTGVEVIRYGKNLFVDIPEQTKYGVTLTHLEDGGYVLNGTAEASTTFGTTRITLQKGIYTLSANNPTHNNINQRIAQVYSASLNQAINAYDNMAYSTGTVEISYANDYWIRLRVEAGITYNNYIVRPHLELGSTATEYEAYKEPQTAIANADGTVEELTSLSPNMTLMTDNDGVVISLDYYKDNSIDFEEV